MANTDMILYRREFVRSFDQTVSLLSERTLDETMSSGKAAIFDVTDLSGDLAERGLDGRIPRLASSDSQVTCVLKEFVGKHDITNYETFTSQSDERKKLNAKISAKVSRRLDRQIIEALASATNQFALGAATAFTSQNVGKIIAELAKQEVPIDPADVTCVLTPNAYAELEELRGFSGAEYVSVKPLDRGGNQFSNKRNIRSWRDVSWLTSPLLPGMGTATAKCYIFHRNALGCAKPKQQIKYGMGYNDEDHYHYCSVSMMTGAKILQQEGVLEIVHDDTA